MSLDVAKDKAARLLKKRTSVSSLSSDTLTRGRMHAGSMSTISFMAEPNIESQPRPSARLEPTYRTDPDRKFPTGQVQHILKEVLDAYLAEERYEPELARQMSKRLTEVVKARVKDLMVPRYKVVSLVHIGQLQDQGLRMGSRCLWDSSNDSFASYEFRNNSLFAVAQVYGVYAE